ncbi:MAG: hypothetical protein HQL23_08830 [Candidatus Omnitrophica bacterium]|nr:hypothetical protein [Candidatus Omnitrophota bacterium]
MKKFVYYFFISLSLTACASVNLNVNKGALPLAKSQAQNSASQTLPEKNSSAAKIIKSVVDQGLLFAKTDFQGLLKTKYVILEMQRQDGESAPIQIRIGEKSGEKSLPWEKKEVEVGYFFIELPAGLYKIKSISIPVGMDVATEPLEILLTVNPRQATYAGTLRISGTKEKVRLGGVPVIKPGFEYQAQVEDERAEGAMIFHRAYPNYAAKVTIQLMEIKK